MMSKGAKRKQIAIIGGGVSGLAAAYRAEQSFPEANVTLLERAPRLGGVLETDRVGDYLIERSADMFSVEPDAALKLCQELGMESELVKTAEVRQRAFVSMGDRIEPVPDGFSLMLPNRIDSILESNLLSESGKQRLLAEEHVPRRMDETDESLKSFATRRFGEEVFERLIQPLVSGIYSADPDLLSMRATMKRFVDMEQEHGSLIAAARAKKNADSELEQSASGARYGLFRAPLAGFQALVTRLTESLNRTNVLLGMEAFSVSPDGSEWRIEYSNPENTCSLNADAVVLACPAPVAGQMLETDFPILAGELAKFQFASMNIVALGVETKQIKRPFNGFGIISPENQNGPMIAASFSSNKFLGRAAEDRTLIRCFIGGALFPDAIKMEEEQLVEIATRELGRMTGLEGVPELARVYRWPNAMPQYHVGHLERIAEIEAMVAGLEGVELAGNSYNGVGIPACIVSGITAVERL